MHRNRSPQDAPEDCGGSLLSEALWEITRLVSRRPKTALCLVLLAACACVVYTVHGIDFKTERADLIDPNAAFHRRWISYTENFGDGADIVVVVEGDDPHDIKRALDDLGPRLEREPELFSNVLYRVEPGTLRNKGLQYLSPAQLETGLKRLARFRAALHENRWDQAQLDAVFARLRSEVERGGTQNVDSALQQAERLAASLAAALANPGEFRSPWPEVLPLDPRMRDFGKQVVYLLNDEGTMGFLKVLPSNGAARSSGASGTGSRPGDETRTEWKSLLRRGERDFQGKTKAISRLREVVGEVAAAHPGVAVGVTGIPVLEHDEMSRSRADMATASIISFLGVGLLLFLGFRGVRHPMLALAMLAVGMAWAFGFTTAAVGHLNILSVSFAVILIGLGIDFAIHYLARYLQLRHEGKPLRPALRETSTGVGAGIVTAAVTTALAFFCATLTQFLGVAELGIIAGGGILLCAAATFLVLPALVALADEHVEPKRLPTPFQGNALRLLISRRPMLVMLASLTAVVAVGVQMLDWNGGRPQPRVRYDYNLLNLQADGLESVEVQKRVFQESRDSLLFAVSVADTPEEARLLRAKFESLPTVHHVEELASRLPAHPPEETTLLVQSYQAQLARLPARPPQPRPLNPAAVGRAAEDFYLAVRRVCVEAGDVRGGREDERAARVLRTIDGFLDRFEQLPLQQQMAFLNAFQARATAALFAQFQALAAAADAEPVRLRDVPPELAARYVSPQGKWLLQVYPRDQIWEVEPLDRFVKEVRSVDPEVTGTPLQNYEASRQIMESYQVASLYALAVVFLVLLVDFLGNGQKWLILLPPLAVVAFGAMLLETRRAAFSPLFLLVSYAVMAGVIAAVLDFRNLRDALLAMLAPLGGGFLMFGIFGLLGIDLNPANLIVLPLVLGIGVDDGVHVIHDFRMQRGRYRTSSSTMNAIVLTSLTSMIGFGSLMVAAHRGMHSVGLVLVIGVGCCLFVSLVTLPAVLTFLKPGDAAAGEPPAKAERPAPTGSEGPPRRRAA